jgi:hypothetical protein
VLLDGLHVMSVVVRRSWKKLGMDGHRGMGGRNSSGDRARARAVVVRWAGAGDGLCSYPPALIPGPSFVTSLNSLFFHYIASHKNIFSITQHPLLRHNPRPRHSRHRLSFSLSLVTSAQAKLVETSSLLPCRHCSPFGQVRVSAPAARLSLPIIPTLRRQDHRLHKAPSFP